jgi:hypothetical protein
MRPVIGGRAHLVLRDGLDVAPHASPVCINLLPVMTLFIAQLDPADLEVLADATGR